MRLKLLIVAALLGCAATIAQQRALARLSVVSMRAEPSHASEQVSQALMGTPVSVLEKGADWSRVETPDGYRGWIINHSLTFLSEREYKVWLAAPKVMVTAPFELHDADLTTDLLAGDVLTALPGDSLGLPDGRRIKRPLGAVAPLDSLCAAPFDPARLPHTAAMYMGVPYLWGGLSGKGMDCSGLVRMAYMAQGRLLPRDAWQQAREGTEVHPDSLQPGDLIFFGNRKTRRITHVAIYEGAGRYVHASQLVRRNSLDPGASDYLPLTVICRRRVPGKPVTDIEKP